MAKRIVKYKELSQEEKDKCCKNCEYCYEPHDLNYDKSDFILSRCKFKEFSRFYIDPCDIGKFKKKSNSYKPPW